MRNLLYLLTIAGVMALVFWAYRENYGTQKVLKQEAALTRQIAQIKENLGMQRAEWAYLNRPARLQELANLNYAKLKLVPMAPEQFADISEIPFPAELPAPPDAPDTKTATTTGTTTATKTPQEGAKP